MITIGKDIRIEAKEFKGKFYIHIRKWFEKDGAWFPSQKGISLTQDEWMEFISKFEEIKKDVEDEYN